MHAARVEDSKRLKRVLRYLQFGGWWSTRNLVILADVCAVNSIIAELRANGFDIKCRCKGRGKYQYKLVGNKKQ